MCVGGRQGGWKGGGVHESVLMCAHFSLWVCTHLRTCMHMCTHMGVFVQYMHTCAYM